MRSANHFWHVLSWHKSVEIQVRTQSTAMDDQSTLTNSFCMNWFLAFRSGLDDLGHQLYLTIDGSFNNFNSHFPYTHCCIAFSVVQNSLNRTAAVFRSLLLETAQAADRVAAWLPRIPTVLRAAFHPCLVIQWLQAFPLIETFGWNYKKNCL